MCPRDFLAEDFPAPAQETSMQGRDYLAEEPQETFGQALQHAPGRLLQDTVHGMMGLAGKIPRALYNLSNNVSPDLTIEQLKNSEMQKLAGFAKSGQNIFNTPHDIANYASERLHLIPEEMNRKIQMGRMPDSTEDINSVFGAPKDPHEQQVRELVSHWPDFLAASRSVSGLNPAKYTTRNVAQGILDTRARQIAHHEYMYDTLFNDAARQGVNNVAFNRRNIARDYRLVRQTEPAVKTTNIVRFYRRPTLQNAQRAQSDFNRIAEKYEHFSESRGLTGNEPQIMEAARRASEHIRERMFRNPRNGAVNQPLLDRYRAISHSYGENVVPYRYNPNISQFMNRNITASEMLDSLKKGRFAARRGEFHPEIQRNAALKKLAPWVAGGAGATLIGSPLGSALYKYLSGSEPEI